MTNDEECLRRFGAHCRAFYDASLILYPSSSSLASMHEEKKSEDNPATDAKRRGAEGKVVLEALDRIAAMRSISESMKQRQDGKVAGAMQNSIDNLRQEHASIAKSHAGILTECGLLDIDRFLKKEDDNLLQYIQMRDATRQRSHKISMLHRQSSFFDILSEAAAMHENSASSQQRLTQVNNVQQAIDTIQRFAQKYQSNVGAHPFLAGIHKMLDLQLNPQPESRRSSSDPNYVVRWKFRGSVLTEACKSCHCESDADELTYAREAIQMLFTFLIWIKDIDVEGGGSIVPTEENGFGTEETSEPVLSFEVSKHLSNANLRRILAVLPDPKRLDARATGLVEVVGPLESHDGPLPRKNADGHEDEQWPWFARLEFCTLL
ncbi:hypothetical protein ACHAXT_010425 [Thalassiosira profunda]